MFQKLQSARSIGEMANVILGRFSVIFAEPPTWAEVVSAASMMLYVLFGVIGEWVVGRDVSTWPSLTIITSLISGWTWIVFCLLCSIAQATSVLLAYRTPRMIAAGVMAFAYVSLVGTALPLTPFEPKLGFPVVLIAMNFFAVARHERDWYKPLPATGTDIAK